MSLNLSVVFAFCAFIIVSKAEGPKDPGLIQNVNPNVDVIEGLVCYQCKSSTSELQPLCDKSIFRLATQEEKYNMSLQCPHYQGLRRLNNVT
ncbi:hypothetical protein MTP99_001948 [Tenebrio molitor]|jgi:hypothetical protein|nr:hypothetical protein MTP99_001948 [Tenebrio molitor]